MSSDNDAEMFKINRDKMEWTLHGSLHGLEDGETVRVIPEAELARYREALEDIKLNAELMSCSCAFRVPDEVDAVLAVEKETPADGCAVCGSRLIGSCTLPGCPNPTEETP